MAENQQRENINENNNAKNNKSSNSSSVKVCCRIRPMNRKEVGLKSSICAEKVNDTTVCINEGEKRMHDKRSFHFDHIFGPDSTQAEVFESCGKKIVLDVLNGYNGTIFAYGQTGSGKTFTMEGPDVDDADIQGMIPRCIQTIFDAIDSADEHSTFSIEVSYVEIYLEKIRDLLDPTRDNLRIKKHETVFIEGCTELYISSYDDVMEALNVGATNRATSSTNMNDESSRSHSVFIVTITQKDERNGTVKKGKLYLVDLAGSEKIRKTGASGARLDEAKMINQSLSALGLVIKKLTETNSTHIPYRDSKLTRLLQESLGGNAKTALVICCSPSSFNHDETVSTLRFGERAKRVKNKAKINQERTPEELMRLLRHSQKAIMLLEKKIQMLENELASYRGVEKPVTIKDNKLNKRRLTTGNIRKSGAASRKKKHSLAPNTGTINEEDGDSYSSTEDSDDEERGGNGGGRKNNNPSNSAEMEEIKDEILALKEQLKHYQNLTSELQLERANMMGEHEALKKKLNESNQLLDNINEKDNEMNKQISDLTEKNKLLEEEKVKLEKKFENTKKGNLAMLENTNALEEDLGIAQSKIDDLTKDIVNLNSKLVDEKELSAKAGEETKSLEMKINEKMETMTKLETNISDTKKEVESLEKQVKAAAEAKQLLEKQMGEENMKYVQELTKLKSEVEEKKNREMELKIDVERLQKADQYCDELKEELKNNEIKTENRIIQLENKHAESIKSVAMRAAKAETMVNHMEESLKAKETEITQKEQMLKNMTCEYEQKIEEKMNIIESLTSKLSVETGRFNKLSSQFETEKATTAKLLLEKDEKITKLNNINEQNIQRVASVEKEIEEQNKLRVSMQMTATEEKLKAEQEIGEAKQLLEDKENELSSVQEKLNAAEKFQKEAIELHDKISNMNAEYTHEKKEMEKMNNEKISRYEDEIEKLHNETNQANGSIKKLDDEILVLKNKCNELTSNIESEKVVTSEKIKLLENAKHEIMENSKEVQRTLNDKLFSSSSKHQELLKSIEKIENDKEIFKKEWEDKLSTARNSIQELENRCEEYSTQLRDSEKELHNNILAHKNAISELKGKHNEQIRLNQIKFTKNLEDKNLEINALLREKDEMNVKHGKAADELKASLNTVMAERDRSQAAEETMRIASSEQKEAVEQKLMSQLDTVQKDLQKSREAYGSVKAERDRLKDEVVKTQEGLAELRGQQTTLNNNLAMLKGVNETLQLTTQKVKSLEGKVEEKTSEARMENERAMRAEEMLNSEKKEFQRQLKERIEEMKSAHEVEATRLTSELTALKEKFEQQEVLYEKKTREASIKQQKLEKTIEEKGEYAMQLIQTHKSELNEINKRRDEERVKYEERVETIRLKLNASETELKNTIDRHNTEILKLKEGKKSELENAMNEEKIKQESLLASKNEEKNKAMEELRNQLNSERDKAVNNCMQTTMNEMQKALKDAAKEKENTLLSVRNEWKDKVSEQMLKFENEKKETRKDHRQKVEAFLSKIRKLEDSLEQTGEDLKKKQTECKDLISKYDKKIKELNNTLDLEGKKSTEKILELENSNKELENHMIQLKNEHEEEHLKWTSQSTLDITRVVEDETKKREKITATFRVEKKEALNDLRKQLTEEKNRAITSCMETTMSEMQKALRKAATQKEAALTKVRDQWKQTLEEERKEAKMEMLRQIEVVKEQTRNDIETFKLGGKEELNKRLEELKSSMEEEHQRVLKELEMDHQTDLEVQEKDLTLKLTEEFKLQQVSTQSQHKQMLFKLGHNDTEKRLAMEKAKAAPEKRKTSWFPFGRRKEEEETNNQSSVGRTMHSDSVTAAQDVVVGGDINPFNDPDLPEKYAASCESVAALMMQVQEHAEMTMKTTEENENLKDEIEKLRNKEAIMQNTINSYNSKITRLMRGNDMDEQLSKLTLLETSCQELKLLIRAANKENQQLKMDLEIQGIKSSRKDKRIKELEEKVQQAKMSDMKRVSSSSANIGGKLRVPLRGGGGLSNTKSSPSLIQRRNRRRSYSGRISNESTPIQRNKKSFDGSKNLISAGSKTPFVPPNMFSPTTPVDDEDGGIVTTPDSVNLKKKDEEMDESENNQEFSI